MTPVDDLHVNQWVAISECIDDPVGITGLFEVQSPRLPIDGRPLQILAISLPFLCVTDGHARFSIDVRRYKVVKLHRTFVDRMKRRGDAAVIANSFHVKEADVIVKPACTNSRPCPNCGDQLIERAKQASPGVWFWACRTCGFEGGSHKNTFS